jgi:hypothetical protein
MNTNDQLEKFNFEYRWTKTSKQLLVNELMESYLYENLTRFQETKFENSQQSLNKATEIISDIYIKPSDKCMKKRNFFISIIFCCFQFFPEIFTFGGCHII